MTFKLLHNFYVLGLSEQIDTAAIDRQCTDSLTELALSTISRSTFPDWLITFDVVYIAYDANIRLFTSTKSDVARKQKTMTIHIPIPLRSQVSWGITEAQKVDLGLSSIPPKYFKIVPIRFADSLTLEEHIIHSLQLALKWLMQIGFTLQGVPITFRTIL